MSTNKWLEKSLASLEQGDFYDSMESFQGAIFRAMKKQQFEEAQKLFHRAISEFDKHTTDEVLFRKIAGYFLQLATKIGREPQALAIVFEAGRNLMESESYIPAIELLNLVILRSEDDIQDIQELIAVSYQNLALKTTNPEEKIIFNELAGLYFIYTSIDKSHQIFNKLAVEGDIKHGCYSVIVALISDDINEGNAILEGISKAQGFMKKRQLGKDPYYTFSEKIMKLYDSQDTLSYKELLSEYRLLLSQDNILDKLTKVLLKRFPKIEPQGFPGNLFGGGGGFNFPPSK